jgi:PEP-CTERM motif
VQRLLLISTLLAAMSIPSAAATLSVQVFDNSVLEGSATSSTGSLHLDVQDPAFTFLVVSAFGAPTLSGGDLLSVLDAMTSPVISSSHTLLVNVFQSGIATSAAGTADWTFNAFDPGDAPGVGPTTETIAINGGASTLGTPIASRTFVMGALNEISGQTTVPALFADANQYATRFSAPSTQASFFISTAIPEPSTWAMLLIGFGFMARAGMRYRPNRGS